MPFIRRQRAWTRQPQHPVKIRWSSPLTRGLVDVIDLRGTPRSLILGTPASYFGTNLRTSRPTRKGLAFDTTTDSGGVYFQRSDGLYAPATQTHISIAEYITPSQIYAGFFCSADGAGANASLSLQWMDVVDCWIYPSSIGLSGFSPHVVNVGVIALGLSSSSSGTSIFVDGDPHGSNAAVPTSMATSRLVLFGERAASQTYSFKGRHLLHLFYNRVLSANEHRLIAENPWQIFEPETVPLFYSTAGGATNLSIFDALHSHAGDSPAFSLTTYLAAQDSSHAHSADNLTLNASLSTNLVIAEALHGLSSDTVSLITGAYLQVADSLHGQSADALSLATAVFLAVADALHTHSADNLTIDTSNATPLTLQDTTHAHSTDNNLLTLDTWLTIVDAVHAHSADNVSISSEELLAIADALHSLASDALILAIPSPPGTCPTAAEIAAAIIAAAQVTPIYADIRKVNNLPVNGSGTDGDPWGP